jgi:hypothetical protein
MSGDGGEVDVHYLVRLIVQFENSALMHDKDLVRCQELLPLVCCADVSTICVAWGRRIVVMPTHTHTHPLFFAAAVTPSTSEMVTSLCCVRSPGYEDVMILAGTSEGYLQVHFPTGHADDERQRKLECIHRQRVQQRAILHMSLSCDSSTVCMTSIEGMVLLSVIEILSARQWWLKTGRETAELDARVFETYTSGPRQATVVSSRNDHTQEHSLYEALMAASKRTGEGGAHATDRNGATGTCVDTVTAMSIGRDPPIAWFKLDRSAKSKGIMSSLMAMSSKMLFGRQADEAITGTHARASRANSGTHVVERPEEVIGGGETKPSKKERQKLRGELVSPLASIWDEDKRGCFGLVCWRDEWAACCDTLGRVMVIDIRQRSVVKMIKGYRECHLGWSAGSGEVLLLIYAPKRRSLELWDVCSGDHKPRARVDVTNTGILIPSDAGVSFLLDYGSLVLVPITLKTFSGSFPHAR